jgi:hypothetical protein
MQSYYSANVWIKSLGLPYTCKSAHPVLYESVNNCEVIKVIDAKYRNATLTGYFVLSPFVVQPIQTGGTGKIDVLCRWFRHRLVSTGLTLKVDFNNVTYFPNYSGDVVSDLGK